MKPNVCNPLSHPGPSKLRSSKILAMGLDKDDLDPLADRFFPQWVATTLVNHPQLKTKGMVKQRIINGKSPINEIWDERKQNYSSDQSVIWRSPHIG